MIDYPSSDFSGRLDLNKSLTLCDGIKKSHGNDAFLNVLKCIRVSVGEDMCEMRTMTKAVLEGQASEVYSQLVNLTRFIIVKLNEA